MKVSPGGRALAVLGGAALLLAGCSPSPAVLEEAAAELPGVIAVEAAENDGDDAIPFVTIPATVDVLMAEDVSASDVMAVFDAYGDEIDDGDVESVRAAVDGDKETVLLTGEGIHATSDMAQDLVAAAADEDIRAYRREAVPVLPGVDIRLAPLGFRQAVAVVDRYRDAQGIDLVQVRSGGFLLIRDAENADPALYDARERFARAVDERFALTGAVVSNRGTLELFVTSGDRAAASRFVARSGQPRGLQQVVVRPRD